MDVLHATQLKCFKKRNDQVTVVLGADAGEEGGQLREHRPPPCGLSWKDMGAVKLLLLKDSLLAYIPDVDGLFPVHTAAKMGKIDVIELLMETCPNSDELLDNRGRNALHCAIEHRKEKVVQRMCRNPRFGRMVNARDGAGNTPLHLAVKHGRDRMAMLLTQDVRVNLSVMN